MAPKLLAFFVLFLALAFAWPTWRVWRREKVNAFTLPLDDTAEGVVGRYFRLTLVALLALLAALSAGLPPSSVAPLRWLEISQLQLLGWTVLIASLAWVMVAQAQMGASWRIGIDSGTRPALVQAGVFRLSRNPIFLGMRASLLGAFLVLPNAVTFAVMLLGDAMIKVQVRLEEAHLIKAHPQQYEAYRRMVRRWL